MVRGIAPSAESVLDRAGVQIHYQVFGDGPRTLLLLPTWSIVHSDFWRYQVSAFANRYKVVTFDGRGNGASGRPPSPEDYSDDVFFEDALAVIDAAEAEEAAVLSVSAGANWGLMLASMRPERVSAAVFIAPSLALGEPLPERAAALAVFDEPQETYEGWLKFNRHYWHTDWPDFLRFFFGKCFTEPGSERQIEHFIQMGLETTPEIIAHTADAPGLDGTQVKDLAGNVACPVLVVHGDHDAISPVDRGRLLARHLRGELVVMPAAGHEPQCRWPDATDEILENFLARAYPPS